MSLSRIYLLITSYARKDFPVVDRLHTDLL